MPTSWLRSFGVIVALVFLSVSLPSQPVSAATIDGKFDQTGPLGAGTVFNLPVLGRGGVPASGVGSVALNVTVTRPSATSFVTVWPTGKPRPNASNLNFVAGQTVPNMVIVPVGVGGQISIFNESGSTDVLVDVLGWFPTGSSFTGLTPARLLDSRIPSGGTVDGAFSGIGQVGGGVVFNLRVSGRGGVPASGVGSVALNVTVARPSATSFLSVWPAGKPRPNASNLNFIAGQTVPNMVIVPIGAGGQISMFNESGSTDVLVDVLGWFPTGPSFTGLTPGRLLDTRVPSGGTVDGAFSGGGQLGGRTVFNLRVSGRGGVPASGVGSVALNVTVARPSEAGFLTVWPAGRTRPNASNLNFTPGQTVPNMVIVPIGVGGQISMVNESGSTDVLVDVLGWFPSGGSFTGLTPARLLDSRRTPPDPFTYRGQGPAVIQIAKPAGGAAVVELDIRSGSNAIVWALDANLGRNELLVNEIGDYKGVRLMDLPSFAPKTSAFLDIRATGTWTIRVRDTNAAPPLDSSATGRGDSVLRYTGPARVMRLVHGGQSNFIVWHHRDYLSSNASSDLVVNEIGPYNATRPFRAGPALIEISADGKWSISP